MNRNFALSGLMRVRELQEERAAADLARANKARLDAQVARAVAEQSLANQSFPADAPADMYEERRAHEVAVSTPTWRAIVAARASATALLGEYNHAVYIASEAADAATGEWSEARMRAAMISKLKVKHLREVEAADLREEQIVLDESSLRRAAEVTQ
ncbi:flagellar export protein FliJ [Demequina sp. TTPB684]|uniref:flagellar export protein FliJ n=1 Tax=unclassified Demequina TaxID=2620311 RepID=UPI001CF177B5|nr:MULTISPECIES: flagellar export protein FliJ [unclassified Demequina]MCB2411332.1 flagellar export protein FliJ [Demequina sp. TTPB684]UPU87892.1 flagellar export protein FliJ [Demequina sp. TMPB413]